MTPAPVPSQIVKPFRKPTVKPAFVPIIELLEVPQWPFDMSKLPKTMAAELSTLNNLTMFENVPVERIQAVRRSPELRKYWENKLNDKGEYYTQDEIDEFVTNEKHMLLYESQLVKRVGQIQVKWMRSGKYGRAYSENGRSLIEMRKGIRQTLTKNILCDLDQVNSQPRGLLSYCWANDIPCQVYILIVRNEKLSLKH